MCRADDSINGRAFGKNKFGWCHRDAGLAPLALLEQENIVTLESSSVILPGRRDGAVMEAFSRASSGPENSAVDELLTIAERDWKVLRHAQLAIQGREHEALTECEAGWKDQRGDA